MNKQNTMANLGKYRFYTEEDRELFLKKTGGLINVFLGKDDNEKPYYIECTDDYNRTYRDNYLTKYSQNGY